MPTRRQVLQMGGIVAGAAFMPKLFSGAFAPRAQRPDVVLRGPSDLTDLSWLPAERVHAHTRLQPVRWAAHECVPGPQWLDTTEFEDGGALIAALGAKVLTRQIKQGEDPWWPASLPLGNDYGDERLNCGVTVAEGRNIAQEIIDEAHLAGLKSIMYYWHMTEEALADANPDWICKDPAGGTLFHARGAMLDITGPFGDIVKSRLVELAAMGADGFYFDNRHLPAEGVYGSALEDDWVLETSEPVPTGGWTSMAPVYDHTDADYRRYLAFKARRMEETIAGWKTAVQALYPGVAFIVSVTTLSGITDPGMTTGLARVADFPKNEWEISLNPKINRQVFENDPTFAAPPDDVRRSLGWAVIRDAADGRPPHIWTTGLPNTAHALGFVAHLVTHGCVANVDVAEEHLVAGGANAPAKTPLVGVEAAFDLGALVSPPMAGADVMRWAGCLFSEASRDLRGGDYGLAWAEVLAPLNGAYQVFTEKGVPVGIVNDKQLEDGDLTGYKVLFVPNPTELTVGQAAELNTFVTNGGVVIENDPLWDWASITGRPAALSDVADEIDLHISGAPVQVTNRPSHSYATAFTRPADGGFLVAVTNDLEWIQTTSEGRILPGNINAPAASASGVIIDWTTSGGFPHLDPVAREVISNTSLTVTPTIDGFSVTVPTFDYMALVEIVEGPGA